MFFTIDFTTEKQNFNYLIESCFGVILLYTLIIIILRPYSDKLNQISIILYEVVKMIFLVFLYLIKKAMLS